MSSSTSPTPTVIISTPLFLRLSASVRVFSVSTVGCPSVNRTAIFCESERKANSPVVRNAAAIFVLPPSCSIALIAGSRSLMLLYWSKEISTLASALYLTTPIRTFVCKISNPRIMALTEPRTSRSQVSSPSYSMLVDSSRINATSATWFGHAAENKRNRRCKI